MSIRSIEQTNSSNISANSKDKLSSFSCFAEETGHKELVGSTFVPSFIKMKSNHFQTTADLTLYRNQKNYCKKLLKTVSVVILRFKMSL